jgi:methyl-accepting chemotaxis protein
MLKHKIMGLVCIAALLPVVVLLVLSEFQRNRISVMVIEELNELIRENIRQNAMDVYHTCQPANDFIQRQLDYNLNVAGKILSLAGEVRLSSEKIEWQATNQSTREVTSLLLPRMMLGGVGFSQNRDTSKPSLVVDEVQRLVGGACTVFQRINEQGDMLRIATTVRGADDTRALGTYIPATEPDGSPNPVIASVLRRQIFRGRAYVVRDWYVTSYRPILDSRDEVVGMLFAGVEQKRIEGLEDTIRNIRVGKTGNVYVVGGKGEFKGRYIIADEARREGPSGIWDARDADGRQFGQSIVDKALALKPGQVDFERYRWKAATDSVPRSKVAAVSYFEPWDWIIVASTFEDEFYEAHEQMQSELSTLFWWSLAGGTTITGLVLAFALVMAGKAADPITRITGIAQMIAGGDLMEASKSVAAQKSGGGLPESDETGQLLQAINQMTDNLNSLVGQVKQSTIQLVSTSTEIAAASKQQEATVSDFGASTSEVVAATKEISATSQDLVRTMNDVTQLAASTASLAGSGRSGLGNMESTMRQLADATRSISNKLAVISEKTNNINSVVTTITKVADETNLLSLNAAIEAEKAGEYGLGFSVVAREIRRLADQTAVATLDIEQMVKDMRSAVSAGVMEMDKFTQEVRRSSGEVQTVSGHLSTIIEQVQSLTPRFDSVSHGMQVQAQGADQIAKAMVQLNDSAQQTAQSLREFNKATEQLNEAARNLRSEVSRFKV